MMALDLQSQVVLNPLFRFQWEPTQDCHVLLFAEGMVQLNESAAAILKLCTEPITVQELSEQLQQQFPEAEALAEDILEFLADAQQEDWILIANER